MNLRSVPDCPGPVIMTELYLKSGEECDIIQFIKGHFKGNFQGQFHLQSMLKVVISVS